ncbi:PhnB protein [Chitinophaga ginsengisegetis]|uniref:PhnB protein n=1 Tax=Chitinophaga ginsengisegetis TaxID=393003 RepID=A0A1T5PCE8_9BACT|nr:VOC family protein [Chitinophaga ginsengisegetis]SKD09939.1 PhnB protein [Chitinophaga ginsengisegetis]
MATTNIYLTFNGNCEEAFNFYKSVFGGEFSHVARFGEMPPDESCQVSEAEKNKIMHISLPIGSSVLMGSDTGEQWATSFAQGNNFSVSVSADSKAEAEKLFGGLAKYGQITMPLADTFWGSYFGMIVDQFAINWMVGFDDPSKEKK